MPHDEKDFLDYRINPADVKRRSIYRDSFKSKNERFSYKLRPNAIIALAACPDLFDREHAAAYLNIVEEVLMCENSLGIKTLDPKERQYKPFYDNANDGESFAEAQGFSYHNVRGKPS